MTTAEDVARGHLSLESANLEADNYARDESCIGSPWEYYEFRDGSGLFRYEGAPWVILNKGTALLRRRALLDV